MSLVNNDMIDDNELRTVSNSLITCSNELNLATSDLVKFVAVNQISIEEENIEYRQEKRENTMNPYKANGVHEFVKSCALNGII